MSTKKQYTEEFKKTIVNLYQSGKSYTQLHTEYGISSSALSNWVHRYSEVKIDENTVLTAQQIKDFSSKSLIFLDFSAV